MIKYINLEIIEGATGTSHSYFFPTYISNKINIEKVLKYVKKTSLCEFFVSSQDYLDIISSIQISSKIKEYPYPTTINSDGQTKEGYPFISYCGIKIIMMSKEKEESLKLLL